MRYSRQAIYKRLPFTSSTAFSIRAVPCSLRSKLRGILSKQTIKIFFENALSPFPKGKA